MNSAVTKVPGSVKTELDPQESRSPHSGDSLEALQDRAGVLLGVATVTTLPPNQHPKH